MTSPSAPETYRDRAKQLRELAETEKNAEFRAKLMDLVEQYEALARRAERRST